MKEKIIEAIDVIEVRSDYWFIRTDGGQYFNTFFENGFIGIGWNDILLRDLRNPINEVKSKIARTNELDLTTKAGRSKTTDIYNKITRFNELRKNDVVVIPSENSSYICFGLIDDDALYEDAEESHNCPYVKRRRVKWLSSEPKAFELLDSIFYKIRKSRHAISNINEYADYIDSEMYGVYQKNDKSHFVINVNQTGEINWYKLATTLVEMHRLMSDINDYFELQEDVDDGSIQISLQSPGLFNLGHRGIALVLLATLLGASSCERVRGNLSPNENQRIDAFQEQNAPRLDSLKTDLEEMDVNL